MADAQLSASSIEENYLSLAISGFNGTDEAIRVVLSGHIRVEMSRADGKRHWVMLPTPVHDMAFSDENEIFEPRAEFVIFISQYVSRNLLEKISGMLADKGARFNLEMFHAVAVSTRNPQLCAQIIISPTFLLQTLPMKSA